MVHRIIVILCYLCLYTSNVWGYTAHAPIDTKNSTEQKAEYDEEWMNAINEAFNEANEQKLQPILNETVEMIINKKHNIHTQLQAQYILGDFFKNNPPTDFTIKYKGGDDDDVTLVSSLKTDTMEEFDVYILLLAVNGKMLIHQIRIEPKKER